MSVKPDRYKYFKIEAREILDGLAVGVLELEKGASTKPAIAVLLRLAHTLKGASRVVRQPRIAEEAHAIEGVLTPYREGGVAVPNESVREILRRLEVVTALIAALDVPLETQAEGAPPNVTPTFESVRVDVGEMDALLEGIAETSVQLGTLGQAGANVRAAITSLQALQESMRAQVDSRDELERTLSIAREMADELASVLERLDRGTSEGLERVRAELGKVRDAAQELRLLPASTLFAPIERAARDAAQSTGKRVTFAVSGGDVRLDAPIVTLMRDALLHVAINAVAHGIEAPPERTRLAKPIDGRLSLTVERRGDQVAFILADDGRGIDVAAIRRVAVGRGVISEADAARLGLAEAVGLVLGGGLSTAGALSEVSGRGIGLDVVRTVAERLRGKVTIESEPSVGTRVEVLVPVTLSSVEALQIDAGGIAASIPLHAVRCAVRLTEAEIARTDSRESIVHEGKVIPFAPLESALTRRPGRGAHKKIWSAVIVDVGGQAVAMGVDRLLGTAKIIVRAVPARRATDPVVAGTTFDAEGNPELVLDPAELIRAVRREGHAPPVKHVRPRAPVLIIDDSLTTRMLEKSILESAGYDVDLANSAEEALTKARERPYCLFLCDVEMPGMDGFAFVALTREDQMLRNTPAILVTSRSAPEDKLRGQKVGASAYVVKSAFDQGVLLEMIERLVG